MLYTTVPLTTLESALVQLKKLDYNSVQPLIDNLIYCINKYTLEDEPEEQQRNPVGFQVNNNDITDEEDDGDDGDDGFCD